MPADDIEAPRRAALRGRARGPVAAAGATAAIGLAGLVILVSLAARGQPAATANAPALPPAPHSTAPVTGIPSQSAGAGPFALDGWAWEELGIGAFDAVERLAFHRLGDGLLAVGTSRTADTRLWRSPDGRAWTELDASALAASDPAAEHVFVAGVVRRTTGYLAAGGAAYPDGNETYARTEPRMWQSTDGSHWIRLATGGLPHRAISSIVQVGNGYLIAFMAPALMSGGLPPLAVYRSDDGLEWHETAVESDTVVEARRHVVATDARTRSIVVTEDGLTWTTAVRPRNYGGLAALGDSFALISEGSTSGLTLERSDDGHQWSRLRVTDGETAGIVGNLQLIVMAGGGYVSVGRPGEGWDTVPLAVSTDLIHWRAAAIPQQVVANAMLDARFVPYGGGFLATASHEDAASARLDAYGSLQVHLWFVRPAAPGDLPGATRAPTAAPATPPATRITAARAIAIALAQIPNTTGPAPTAKLVTIGAFDPKQTKVAPDRLVWAVQLLEPKATRDPSPCPAPTGVAVTWCSLPYRSLSVIVDADTGDVIEIVDHTSGG